VLAAALLAVLAPAIPTRTARPKTVERRSTSAVALIGASDGIDRIAMVRDRATRNADATRNSQVRPAPGRITGWWGERRRGHIHSGVDIDGNTGDPVVAAAWGTVSYVGTAPKGFTGYGQIVVIDHDGFQTLYAHLSRIDTAVGELMLPGAAVGAIGTSGSVTGSHLHFEVLVNGKPVDPATFIRVL
jgi:murein DD-endopeptidase MepM/ murein hydrolase activator NlpD